MSCRIAEYQNGGNERISVQKRKETKKEKSKVATYCAVVLHLPPYSETREGLKQAKKRRGRGGEKVGCL